MSFLVAKGIQNLKCILEDICGYMALQQTSVGHINNPTVEKMLGLNPAVLLEMEPAISNRKCRKTFQAEVEQKEQDRQKKVLKPCIKHFKLEQQ